MKKIALSLLAIMVLVGFGTTVVAAEKEPFKIAFIHKHSLGEAWTDAQDAGRVYVQEHMPGVETAYSERVDDADVERIARGYVAQGYDMIFAISFGYMDPIITVAKSFPNTVFISSADHLIDPAKAPSNVGMVFGRMYQARYLSGIVAGAMTKTNKIGFVEPFPIVEHIRGLDAFTLGATEVNPDAMVKVIYTMSWADPPKEKEAALALINDGCDVLSTGLSSVAAIEEAERKGIYAIANDLDKKKYAPNAQITGNIWDWGKYFLKLSEEVRDGTWKPGFEWPGLKEGVVTNLPFSDRVPRVVQLLVEAKKKLIENGFFRIFEGPIYAQDGALKIPAGVTPSEHELYGDINWLVKGVIGSIPKW